MGGEGRRGIRGKRKFAGRRRERGREYASAWSLREPIFDKLHRLATVMNDMSADIVCVHVSTAMDGRLLPTALMQHRLSLSPSWHTYIYKIKRMNI